MNDITKRVLAVVISIMPTRVQRLNLRAGQVYCEWFGHPSWAWRGRLTQCPPLGWCSRDSFAPFVFYCSCCGRDISDGGRQISEEISRLMRQK